MKEPVYVYCLIDPINRQPFYIGISRYHWYRFEQHRTDRASPAYGYVNALLNRGIEPQQIYKIYKKCPDRITARELEYRLITSAPRLLNRDRNQPYRYEAAA